MKDARTEQLIVALVADGAAVTPLPPVRARVWRWLGASTALTAAGTWLIGVRPDLASAGRDAAFVGDAALTTATAGLAAAGAFALSIPAGERFRDQRFWPIAAAAVLVTEMAWRFGTHGGTWQALAAEPWHLACALRMFALAALPAGAAFVMIRRAAPLEPRWAAGLASLAALALGAVGTQLACPLGSTAHMLVSHAVPLAALSFFGIALGSNFLRK
jgi:hypothetical protein